MHAFRTSTTRKPTEPSSSSTTKAPCSATRPATRALADTLAEEEATLAPPGGRFTRKQEPARAAVTTGA
jgi:hypothetical protein